MRNKLLSLFRFHFPQIDIKIVLSNNRTIGSFFPVKERLPNLLCSNVIYHYKCEGEDCESSYVGSTERVLHERICEHKGVSFRTGSSLTSPQFSSIRDHSRSCAHPIDPDSFHIIGRCRDEDNIRLLESVYIKHLRPDLNNTESAMPLHITWSLFSPLTVPCFGTLTDQNISSFPPFLLPHKPRYFTCFFLWFSCLNSPLGSFSFNFHTFILRYYTMLLIRHSPVLQTPILC